MTDLRRQSDTRRQVSWIAQLFPLARMTRLVGKEPWPKYSGHGNQLSLPPRLFPGASGPDLAGRTRLTCAARANHETNLRTHTFPVPGRGGFSPRAHWGVWGGVCRFVSLFRFDVSCEMKVNCVTNLMTNLRGEIRAQIRPQIRVEIRFRGEPCGRIALSRRSGQRWSWPAGRVRR